MRAISLVALGAVVATAIFGAFRFQPTGLAAELNKLDQETDGLAFFRKFCGACHCDKHKGNSKWNACSLESLTSEKPTADILGDYKNAKGYVVPGKPEESLVFLRVKDKSMPKGDGPKPSDDDKKKLEKWIVDLKVKPAKADAPSENQAAGAHSDKPAKSDENAPMSLPRLAFAAYSVFKDKCFGCHHAGREDGAPDFSNPVNIRTKRVGQYVLNGRMPLVGALSYQEKALLLEWIGRDAPGKNGPIKWGEPSPLLPPECRNTDFVELKDNLAAMQSWLFTLDKETQRYTRFLTLTNLHNDIENTSERELRLYRAAVSKVLNSLSTEKDICTPAIVDKGTQTVLAIDLRHYWKNEQGVIKWKRILNQYPYGVDYRQSSDKSIASLAKEVSRITGTDVPFIRADWFVAVATQPPLYHILVGTPATIAKLDDALLDKTLLGKAGVDFAAAFKNKLIIRAATDSGLTTYQNRLVERFERKDGYCYRSYDFDPLEPRSNLVEYPLGPVFVDNPFPDLAFKHGGGEVIYSLPNGLQAYMVVDDHGARQDVGDIRLLKDPLVPPTANTPALVNGLSCIGCHRHGLNTVTFSNQDFVFKAWEERAREENRNGKKGPANEVADLYNASSDFVLEQEKGRKHFCDALQKAMGCFLRLGADEEYDIKVFVEPVRLMSLRFFKYLGLRDVALELGYRPTPEKLAELRKQIESSPRLSRLGLVEIPDEVEKPAIDRQVKVRGLQRINFGICRGYDATHFQILARELKKGTPYWKRFHTQPTSLPDLVAQIAEQLSAYLRQEAAVTEVTLRQCQPIDGIAANLAEALSELLQRELSRQGLRVDCVDSADKARTLFDITWSCAVVLQGDDNTNQNAVQLKVKILNAKTNLPVNLNIESTSVFRADDEFKSRRWLQEASLISVLGLTTTLPEKPARKRQEKLVRPKGTSIVTDASRARVGKDSKYAIELRYPRHDKPIKLTQDSQSGAGVLFEKGKSYQVNLLNESDDDAAVVLAINGLTMFAFSQEWQEQGADDTRQLPRFVIIPAHGSRTVEGWYLDPGHSRAFQVLDTGKGKRPGTITAVFLKAFREKTAYASYMGGSLLGPSEAQTELLTQVGQMQVNERAYSRVSRYIGPALETITVHYSLK